MAVPDSFIKNVALEINKNYDLQNAPLSSDKTKPEGPFIGRKQHIEKLLAFLDAKTKTGVFLVTGYRGMGKTSFVNHVLKRYTALRHQREVQARKYGPNETWVRKKLENNEWYRKIMDTEKIIPIHLTIAQNNPKELDILRLIVMSVFDGYRTYITKKRRWSLYVNLDIHHVVKLLFIPLLLLLLPLVVWVSDGKESYLSFSESFVSDIVRWGIYRFLINSLSIISAVTFVWVSIAIYFQQTEKSGFNRIRWLVDRCYASLSEENSATEEAGIPVINIKLSRGDKRTKQYPIATAKEMEYELQMFLNQAFKKHGVEFIFIFDELDKLDPLVTGVYLYEEPAKTDTQKPESAYERELRERKQAIVNIITGLKNFFTTARAHFIFIAGREMFDASLADISDRQSPISSIFTYVFNIESLLKEKDLSPGINHPETANASLSYGVEAYLKKLLFGVNTDKDNEKNLFELAKEQYTTQGIQIDFNKLYFTLQNFLTYLTYRSNGSPKKLIKEIQEFIKVGPAIDFELEQTLVYGLKDNGGNRMYLYFNYENQYRIGFINYLYRPFLIRFGRSFKLYSDNIIVSTPYLFDHFLKFHPFAFSLSNLELVPEMLSSNKTPSLREHIRQIINYLSGNHIREIEIGLFDYKFYSRTLNEITFLSKIFEQEAAAMNYTLDESHLVKLHVRNKIRDLRNAYAGFPDTGIKAGKVSSIAHLNGTLGDLHFFDQEYDDAIVAYLDAIRLVEEQDIEALTMLDFITVLRNRLKAGLCYEKISSYEFALSCYSDASDDSVKYMTYRLKKGTRETHEKGTVSDLLQIVLQSFMSQIYLQEKKSVAGISELKLCMSLGAFLDISTRFIRDNDRNHIIKAQAFLQAGNLFYFKNNERKPDKDAFNAILPEAFNKRLNILLKWDALHDEHDKKPVLALMLYLMGLDELMNYRESHGHFLTEITVNKNLTVKIFDILENLETQGEYFRGIYYNYVATLISAIGDCLLANDVKGKNGHRHEIGELFVDETWELEHTPKSAKTFEYYLKKPDTANCSMQDVLRSYYRSGQYFLKQGKVSDCSFQYKKILHILRVALQKSELKPDQLVNFYAMLHATIVLPVLDFAAQNAVHSGTHMLNKAMKADVNPVYAENNVSNHPETREVWLLFYYIQLKTGNAAINNIHFFIAPNNSFATQYGRIQELHFYARYLRRELEQGRPATPDGKLADDKIAYFYTMLSILQIMDIYGSDYWMGYSYLANTHFRIADFLVKLNPGIEEMGDMETALAKLMGEGSFSSLDANAHFAKSLDYYEKTIRLHHAGEEYKDTISDMICLEDDFNDSAYHFGAALDRFKLNNGLFKKRIDECRRQLTAVK